MTDIRQVNNAREAKWDNVKCLLIFLVVLGHFADRFAEGNTHVKGLFVAIYLIHMPAFFFVSGLFSKRTIRSEHLPLAKILPLYILSIVLNYFRVLTQRPWNPDLGFRLFYYGNVSWYLFTLFVFLLVSWFLKNLPDKVVLAALLVLALVTGYVNDMGSFLAFYRIGNFFIYFYLGYVLDPARVKAFLDKRPTRAVSAIIIGSYLGACLIFPEELYVYRKLITGANSYAAMSFDAVMPLWIYRLLDILLVAIISGAVFSLAPDRNIRFVTSTGRRTLAIYFWHLAPIEIIVHNSLFLSLIEINDIVLLLAFIICSIAIIAVLRCRVFSIPLDFVMHLPEKRFKKADK